MTRHFLLGALLVAACEPSRPPVVPVLLDPAPDTVIVPWTMVGPALALDSSRWLAVAPNEGVVGIVDFAGGSVSALGGPRHPEYRRPYSLFAAGESTHVGDWDMRRITIWGPDLRMARALEAPPLVRGALPTARDGRGNFYLALYPAPGADGSGNRDSAAIVRLPPDLSRADTVARLAPLDLAEILGNAGRRFEARALSGRDQWGVLPDGTVWVARYRQNRVDRLPPGGTWTRGPSLPDRALLVLQGDRDHFIRQFPEELRGDAARVPFALTKPPFESAFHDEAGRIWLVKSRALADTTRAVQVVGADGHLAAIYQVPRWGTFLGARGGKLLVAESFEDGYRLLRFALPAER